jgi:hypothetical protein
VAGGGASWGIACAVQHVRGLASHLFDRALDPTDETLLWFKN